MAQKKPIKPAPKKAPVTRNYQPITNSQPTRDYHLIFLWVIILFVSAIRWRLLSVPFERDEGEYGYIGNLFLHGMAPFKDAYSMKLPGTSFMYSVFMAIFGHTNTGVHLGLLFMNAATMYIFYTAFKKIFNPFIALVTATVYGFMAIGLAFDAFAAHATHFICFYSSLGLLFLTQFMQSGNQVKIFLFGLMLGMAFLMKQQAVFLIVFGAVFLFAYLKVVKKQALLEIIKKLVPFGAGVFIPYLVVILIVLSTGQFNIFWMWTVQYASTYEAVKSMDAIIMLFKTSFNPAWDSYNFLWGFAFAGLLVLYWSPLTKIQKLFAIFYLVACTLVLSAGFYFRQHYFIALLPALGLMTSIYLDFVISPLTKKQKISALFCLIACPLFLMIFVDFFRQHYFIFLLPAYGLIVAIFVDFILHKVRKFKSQLAGVIILSVMVVVIIFMNKDYFFTYPPNTVCSIAYWGNPFIQAQEVAKYIKENTKDTDKIAVLGSEPEIYFYANRTAATGYLYTYPLVEKQPYNEAMQDEMIKEIEKNKPAFIVFCNISYSWLVQNDTPKKIFEWGNTYTHDHYTPVGFADFFKNDFAGGGWYFYWNENMKNRPAQPVPDSFMMILKRNPDSKS